MTQSWTDGMSPEDIEDILVIAKQARSELRRKERLAMASPDAYWRVDSPKKGPARVKYSLSRPLSDSEVVFFKDKLERCGVKMDDGKLETMASVWQPYSHTYSIHFYEFRVRLSKNQQIYAESTTMGSVRLTDAVTEMLENQFLNVHPVSARTLRELG